MASRSAVPGNRTRSDAHELVRFEVRGRDADRGLIRTLARRLAEDTAEASELRTQVSRSIADEPGAKGGIVAALRRSPLVGADLDLTRPGEERSVLDL